MKKVIFAALLFIIMFAFESNSNIQSYSDSGWSASTGRSWMPGYASNVSTIPYGYHFWCIGRSGVCYYIDGNMLYINNSARSEGEEEDSVEVTITKIPD